jgi:subtilisin family serine protease
VRKFLKISLITALMVAPLPFVASAEANVTVSYVKRSDDGGLSLIRYQVSPSEVESTVANLRTDPAVLTAGVSYRRGIDSTATRQTPGVNDPRTQEQWGWRRLGADDIYQMGTGAGVTVAVLDTGVDASHPELSGKVLPGWDSINPQGDGRQDPNGHGTHVAGIIAATADNSIGIAGVAPGVDILPVRVLDETGYGDDDELAMGIIWAVDHGADILNLSIGGAVPSSLLEGSLDYALAANVLVVVSAGNAGSFSNEPSYPAAYPQALAVGSTDSSDRRSAFSNTGSYLDLAAPGAWVLSTWPGGGYQVSSGTSMAAPFVSASAALILARTGIRGRALGEHMQSKAIDLGPAGQDSEFGAGLVNPLGELGIVPPPVAGVSPTLPSLPPLPDLALPPLPALPSPSVPSLTVPPLPAPPKVTKPALPAPSLPNPSLDQPTAPPSSVPTPSKPSVPSRSVGIELTAKAASSGDYVLTVKLLGPKALVARQRLTLTVNGTQRVIVTNYQGSTSVRLRRPGRTPVTVELPASRLSGSARASITLPTSR